MKKRIHVNQHVIKSNKKNNETKPPLTVKTYKDNQLANKVDILDSLGEVVASVIYSPEKPLSCGARVWIETDNEVLIEKG